MVVLDKDRVNAGLFAPDFLVEAFVKKSARVAENFRLDDQYVGNFGFDDIHKLVDSEWLMVNRKKLKVMRALCRPSTG
jgi:hypothetical protein